MPHRPNAANGHLVRTPELRVWIAGDTSLFDDMTKIPELAGGPIDLAIVPIGGWGARLSGGHLDAGRAAQACGLVGARAAMPYHWGTLYAPGTVDRPPRLDGRPGRGVPRPARVERPRVPFARAEAGRERDPLGTPSRMRHAPHMFGHVTDVRRATPRTDHVLADPRLQAAAARLGPRIVKQAVVDGAGALPDGPGRSRGGRRHRAGGAPGHRHARCVRC